MNRSLPIEMEHRLYNLVIDLFSKKCFHEINFKEISKISRIKVSILESCFPSEEDLLFSIMEKRTSEIITMIRTHIHGMENTREIFKKIFWVVMEYCDRNPGVPVTFFITVPPLIWMKREAYQRADAYAILNEIIQNGRKRNEIDSSLKVSQIMGIFFMYCSRAVQIWYYKNRKSRLVESIPDFFPLFWKTISVSSLGASMTYSFSR